MVIRALAVFERVIHNAQALSTDNPTRPKLEVDAVLREGDADGDLLLPAPSFMAMVGGPAAADPHLRALAATGRIVSHQGIAHIRFPVWTMSDTMSELG